MPRWIHTLAQLSTADAPVLVTVADSRGSVPRSSGAHMIVGAHETHGSVGGGQLEFQAIALARSLHASTTEHTKIVRFPLGASVGQCCGGVVTLTFERLGGDDNNWIGQANALEQAGVPWFRERTLHPVCGEVKVFALNDAGVELDQGSGFDLTVRDLLTTAEEAASIVELQPGGARQTLVDACRPRDLRVFLYGSGHVGRALVEVCTELPMRITWIDGREHEFPEHFPANTDVQCTDVPEAIMAEAPEDALHLIMTHSHALDFDLVHAILLRNRFRFLGLIGSKSKRARFVYRLQQRGLSPDLIERLQCPIGIPGLTGKEPHVIAVAVAAQLLGFRGVHSPPPPGDFSQQLPAVASHA